MYLQTFKVYPKYKHLKKFLDYIVIDVSDTIRNERRVKIEFSSDFTRTSIKVYKLREPTLIGIIFVISQNLFSQ